MDLRNSPVLLTGATGFIGNYVAQELVSRGYQVRALLRSPDSELAKRLPEQVIRVQGDILDAASVEAAVAGCGAVIHCAGKVSRDPADTLLLKQLNSDGAEIVVDAAKKAGVRRFVHAGTSGNVGISEDEDHVANEDDDVPIELINRFPYYRAKYYAQQAVFERNGDGFEVVVVNPSLLLGPGDLLGSSTEDVRRYLEQPIMVCPSGGVAFVDARDAAIGMVLALENGRAGEHYVLSACNCTTFAFFSRIARVAGVTAPRVELPNHRKLKTATSWLVGRAEKIFGRDDSLPDRHSVDISQLYWYVDSSRAEQVLNWRARDPMVTLADTVVDLRERGIVPYGETPGAGERVERR